MYKRNFNFKAFDQHMNLVLGNVEEIKTVPLDYDTTGLQDNRVIIVDSTKKIHRKFEILFVRGDSLIMAAPSL